MAYTISSLDISRLVDNQCSMTVNGSSVLEGTIINAGDSVVVNSNGAGVFKSQAPIVNGPSVAFVTLDVYSGVNYDGFEYFTLDRVFWKSASITFSGADNIVALFIRTYTVRTSDGVPLDGVVFDLFAETMGKLTDNGVVASVGGTTLPPYGVVKAGEEFKLTAETGRAFTTSPEDPTTSAYLTLEKEFSGGSSYVYFSLQNNDKEAVLIPAMPESEYFYSSLGCITVQATIDIVGSNNVYLIDSDILKQVNKKRFKTVTGGVDVSEVTYDYGQFILSVLKIPFTVPPENIILPENITLANFDTGVSAPKINVDVLKINLGEITVPAIENNIYDYVDTVALLHLPRMSSIAIELEYVIGRTISIEYLVDCYVGDATVNIYSDLIDSPIITKSVNIGVNIPYANTNNNAVLDNGNIEVGGDNGVTTAFIELVKVDSILKDGLFTIPIIDEAILNTATGFIQVERIELKTEALRNEKAMLLNVLSDGVIIK